MLDTGACGLGGWGWGQCPKKDTRISSYAEVSANLGTNWPGPQGPPLALEPSWPACDRYQKSLDRFWIKVHCQAKSVLWPPQWGGGDKGKGDLGGWLTNSVSYRVLLVVEMFVLCGLGSAPQGCSTRERVILGFEGFEWLSLFSRGEKSAERNEPSGWLTKSRFVWRSVI